MRTLLLFAILLGTSHAHARWLKEDEAPAHFEEINTEVRINKDLSLEVTQELSAVVDKPAALEELAVFRVRYSPATTQVRILSAKVSAGQHSYLVDPKQVEDKPVPDQKGGYDRINEIRVLLPNIAVRATIDLKLWRKESPVSGYLTSVIPLMNAYPVRAQRMKVESDAPVAWRLHDPFGEFKIAEEKVKKGFKFEISSTQPVFHQLADEPFAAFSEPQMPALYLGSGTPWADLGQKISAEYEKVLSATLPDELKRIAEPLKANADKFEQVEVALTEIRKQVHFLPAWQTVDGRHFPRSLKETVSERFAGPQDYAAVTAAVLRALGHEAQVAWTTAEPEGAAPGPRVVQFQPFVTGFFFNHAIVRAKIAGKDCWLDPSSAVPYVRGVAGHIGGRYALVLRGKDSKLETVPFASAEENTIEATRIITVNNDKTFDELVRSKVRGYVIAALEASRNSGGGSDKELRDTDDLIADLLTKGAAPKAPKGELWIDRARPGADLGAPGAVKFGFPRDLAPFLEDPAKSSGGVFLPVPTKQTLTTIIHGGTPSVEPPKECKVDTPFFKLSRSFVKEGSILRVLESSEIKTAFIPAADLRGPQVKEAKETLERCWKEVTLAFEHDGLIDPKFKYTHTEPWKVSALQLRAEKVKKGLPKLWTKITGKKTVVKTFNYAQADPEWSKEKKPEHFKVRARELIDDWSGQDVKPMLVKLLMLELIAKAPEDPEPLANLAIAELQGGFMKDDEYDPKAVERAKWAAYSALQMDVKSPIANRALARVLVAAKDPDALQAAKFAITLEPESPAGKSTLARAHLRANEAKKALEALGAVEDFPLRVAIYTALGSAEKVAETFEEHVKKKPSAWAYVNYATWANNRGDPDKAIELSKKALEIRDFALGHKLLSESYVRKGSAAMDKSKKVEDGLEWLGKALIEDNSNVLAHQIVGSILIQRGRETKDERLSALGAQHIQTAVRLQKIEDGAGDRAPASAPSAAPGAAPVAAAKPGTGR